MLAIADGGQENASIAVSAVANAIFYEGSFVVSVSLEFILSSDASLRRFYYIYLMLITVVFMILSAKVCPLLSHKGQRNPMKHDAKSTQ